MTLGDNPFKRPVWKNPNKIKIGKIVDNEGIEMNIIVEADHPRRWNYRVWLEPTRKGKESKAYCETKHKLHDDWSTDITDTWSESSTIKPLKMRQKIDEVIEDLRMQGYTRY